MPNVALIQDGTEVSRQRFADVAATFESVRQKMACDRFTSFPFRLFIDEEVDFLLDGIQPDEWSCLVFASNSLLSWDVGNALSRRRHELHRYIASGGGIVVLHQQCESLAPVLPDVLLPMLGNRRTNAGAALTPNDDDVLLRYPLDVAVADLRDLDGGQLSVRGVDLPSLYFTAYDSDRLPPTLKPVLRAAGDVVVTRSQDDADGRVVLVTIPLDWEGQRPGQGAATTALLANSIRYASLGGPRRLVWNEEETTDDELLLRWLTMDGRAAVRPAPAPGAALDRIDAWLLAHVDACIVPADRLAWCEGLDDVQAFLARGGVLATSSPDRTLRASRITALVGRYEERALAARLYGELRAVQGWKTVEHAFELRNIASALAFLAEDPVNRTNDGALDVRKELGGLVDELHSRLRNPKHREDFGSSIALAETLARLEEPAAIPADIVDWLEDEGSRYAFDVKLRSRAVVALCRREQVPGLLEEAAAELRRELPRLVSVAPVVRVLDAVSAAEEAGLLAEAEAAAATELAGLVCDALSRFPPLPGRGWLSVEATADVTRGLAALYGRLPAEEAELAGRVGAYAATGAIALRRGARRYEPDAKGVAKLARLTHSVILAYWRFPLGLQRLASLEWPDAPTTAERSPAAERSLVERLGGVNEKLETDRRALAQTVAEQRLAARVGRAIATTLPVLLLLGGAGVGVWRVDYFTVPGILANIAVLIGVVAGIVTIVFNWLDRRHLLAAPAAGVRSAFESVALPILSGLGKLKRG